MTCSPRAWTRRSSCSPEHLGTGGPKPSYGLTQPGAGERIRSMAWNLEGTYFETCSCETPCPCTVSLSLGADLDYCRVVLAFNIASGDVDGTDVGGVGTAMVVDAPKVMTDGGWKVGLFIDDGASDEQAEALGQVFSGALGGPPASLGPLLGEFLGVERAAMQFDEDGLMHSLKIGDSVDIEIEDVVPFGVESG